MQNDFKHFNNTKNILADSESEEELEPLHIPEIPNKVLWLQSTPDDTIWLSMGGYDAGYIYEYSIDQTSDIPSRYIIIFEGDDTEINNFIYKLISKFKTNIFLPKIFYSSHNKRYLILAMQDGSLKLVKVNPDDWRDLSDYWQLSMHDNHNSFIPRMCFSHDEKYFFSCGYDGNIFSYRFYPDDDNYIKPSAKIQTAPDVNIIQVADVDGYKKLSLEESKIKAEQDRNDRVANRNRKIVFEKLLVLKGQFQVLLNRNNRLPTTQIIPREQLEIDPIITNHLDGKLTRDLELVQRKLAFDVEKSKIALTKLRARYIDPIDVFPITVTGIENTIFVKTERQCELTPQFKNMSKIIEQKIIEAELKNL